MKKNYFFMMAGAMLISGSVVAQSSQTMNYQRASKKEASLMEAKKAKKVNKPVEKGALLWEDDFSDINTWTLANSSTPATDFSQETNPDLQSLNVTTMPAELTPFASTTASNGFLWISSDAAPGNADGDGTPIEVTATSEVIDLTGSPFVTLTFEHNYRWWQDLREVRVSGDNGANWETFILTDENGPDEQNSGNPEITQIDISAVAGGQSEVLVQFYYNDQDFWGWYWAIDDVRINEADQYDLRNDGIYWGHTGNIGTRVAYHQVPLDQIAAYDVSGRVSNIGYEDQTDAEYTVSVASEGFSTTSPASTVLGFAQDTIDCPNQFTPSTLGMYIFDGDVTSGQTDATPTNNTVTGADSMEVTNYVYARDAWEADGGFFPEVAFEGGPLFDINVDADLYGLDVGFGNSLGEGIEVYGTLYEIDANGEFAYIAETEYYTTQAGDANTMRTLVFENEIALTAGTTYLVTLGSFSTELSLAVAGESPDQTCFLYGDLGEAGVDWYFTNSTPMVRMNFDPILNVEAPSSMEANVSLFPNPANEETNVNFTLENASDVEVVVTDLSGKAVYTVSMNNVAAGEHTVVVPTEALSNGVYVVNYTAGNAIATRKLVVNK